MTITSFAEYPTLRKFKIYFLELFQENLEKIQTIYFTVLNRANLSRIFLNDLRITLANIDKNPLKAILLLNYLEIFLRVGYSAKNLSSHNLFQQIPRHTLFNT